MAIPDPVMLAYGFEGAAVRAITVGWINRTFLIERDGSKRIVQRLHPVFGPAVNLDLEAITKRLSAEGLLTPELVRTTAGEPCVLDDEAGCWRALTYIEGRTVDALEPPVARSAGRLVGLFHRALAGFEHTFHFTRVGVHDTAAHLARLAEASRDGSPVDGRDDEIRSITQQILETGHRLPTPMGLRERIIHGDLKATNLRLAPARDEVIAILDLDTLAHGTLDVELGDALRSWCNRTNEADAEAHFDRALFVAAMEGYAEGIGDEIEPAEVDSIVAGAERICVELASRFAKDLFGEGYFGWDESRFASRTDHNLARCHAQLGLARSIQEQRETLLLDLRRIFRR